MAPLDYVFEITLVLWAFYGAYNFWNIYFCKKDVEDDLVNRFTYQYWKEKRSQK